jgi:3alpha(or 20beta)-hydroxysteroid dehydrogenase
MPKSIELPGLEGKLVVITGANGGQGAAEALTMIASGAVVIATDIQDEVSAQLADGAAALRGSLHYRKLDVASEADWAAVAEFTKTIGPVWGLVNNAGIPFRARLGEVKLEDWNRVIGINLTGAMLGMQALAPLMTQGGSIVNIGSAAAVTGHYTAAYTSSKWGLRGLTHVAATEYGAKGIRVNLVNPGYIETPMMAAAPAIMTQVQLELTPLERTGQPEDVAAAVAFLISDISGYISGAELPVDGAFTSSAGVKYMSDAIRNFNQQQTNK